MIKKNPKFFLHIAKEMLESGNNFRFKASGKSMHPFIEDGDILTVAPLSKPLGIGHIAFYTDQADRLTAHRIHKIIKNKDKVTYIIKGDARFFDTEYVPHSYILGVVISLNRNSTEIRLDSFFNRYYPICLLHCQQFKSKAKYKLKLLIKKILRK